MGEPALSLVSQNTNHADVNELLSLASEVILDKEREIKLCMACLLARGHLLIEDRPGMGKTSLVKTLARLLGLGSQRIQFTNDLLPADITGTSIFNNQTRQFEFFRGPIFANFVLADEINRATPKTQSACLQAMEEYQISIDGKLYALPQPFFLVATQNPQENVGTFLLPESQLDRFLMKLEIGFPSRAAERQILLGKDRSELITELPQLFDASQVVELSRQVDQVFVSENILDYLQDLVERSRSLGKGLSPRAAKDLNQAAKAWAFIEGRNFVIPEDVQAVAVSVMNHRMDSAEGSASGVDLANEILSSVSVR